MVDNKIYIFRGLDENGNPTNIVDCYDVETNTWSRKSNMPYSTYGATSSVVNGKIYIMGGYNSSYSVYCYDPVADTYTQKTSMQDGRYFGTSETVDGKIYVFGVYNSYPNRIACYYPESDSWEYVGPTISQTQYLTSAVIDKKNIFIWRKPSN